jgi:hypothetical protein
MGKVLNLLRDYAKNPHLRWGADVGLEGRNGDFGNQLRVNIPATP